MLILGPGERRDWTAPASGARCGLAEQGQPPPDLLSPPDQELRHRPAPRAELGSYQQLPVPAFRSTLPLPRAPTPAAYAQVPLTRPLAFLLAPEGSMRASRLYTLVLVVQPERILLGMKKRGFGAGRWNGFGGKVEEGETIEDGAKR